MIAVIARQPVGTQYIKMNCDSLQQAERKLTRCRKELSQLTPKDTATKFAIVNVKTPRNMGDIVHPVEYEMIYSEQ